MCSGSWAILWLCMTNGTLNHSDGFNGMFFSMRINVNCKDRVATLPVLKCDCGVGDSTLVGPRNPASSPTDNLHLPS